MLFAPESPRWLASRSRRSEAEGEGKRLWGPQAAEELGEGAEQAADASSCEMEPLTGPPLPEAAAAAGADGTAAAQAASQGELEQQSSSGSGGHSRAAGAAAGCYVCFAKPPCKQRLSPHALPICPRHPTLPTVTSTGCIPHTRAEKVVPSGAKAAEASWGEALASKSVRIGCILFLLQQFSGINAIVYFSSSVFQVRLPCTLPLLAHTLTSLFFVQEVASLKSRTLLLHCRLADLVALLTAGCRHQVRRAGQRCRGRL